VKYESNPSYTIPTPAVGDSEYGEKRANSRPDDFRALTIPEVAVFQKSPLYTSSDFVGALPETENRKWIRLTHRPR